MGGHCYLIKKWLLCYISLGKYFFSTVTSLRRSTNNNTFKRVNDVVPTYACCGCCIIVIFKKVTFFCKRLYALPLLFLTLDKLSILLLYILHQRFIHGFSLSLWFRWNAWQERTGSSVAGWRPTNPRDQRLGMLPYYVQSLKGTVPRDFRFLVFSWIRFPQAPAWVYH